MTEITTSINKAKQPINLAVSYSQYKYVQLQYIFFLAWQPHHMYHIPKLRFSSVDITFWVSLKKWLRDWDRESPPESLKSCVRECVSPGAWASFSNWLRAWAVSLALWFCIWAVNAAAVLYPRLHTEHWYGFCVSCVFLWILRWSLRKENQSYVRKHYATANYISLNMLIRITVNLGTVHTYLNNYYPWYLHFTATVKILSLNKYLNWNSKHQNTVLNFHFSRWTLS